MEIPIMGNQQKSSEICQEAAKALRQETPTRMYGKTNSISGSDSTSKKDEGHSRSEKEGQASFQNPFLSTSDASQLDPKSSNFHLQSWITNLVGYTSANPQRYPRQSLGVCFRDLAAYGVRTPTFYQKTVGNVFFAIAGLARWITGTGKHKIQILSNFNGLVQQGEMLLVLGRPGSGCSTFLKTISGDIHGFTVDSASVLNYHGIPASQMHEQFAGEAIYMAETDVHFPQLTVGQTLLFAAKSRAPRDDTFPGVTREKYAEHMRDVIMATFGLTHVANTNVGNDLVKGISGGERKRVSLAEAALSGSSLQCWDNSTRGLDSANALEFCRNLRLSTSIAGATVCVALYQASQDAYDIFDKVTVLYHGRQIYFGPCSEAKAFFERMGFVHAPRQNTADFLTSLTNPAERTIKAGFEGKTPRNAAEFTAAWEGSTEYTKLMGDIDTYEKTYPVGGNSVTQFASSRRSQKAKNQRIGSPYNLSLMQQISLCVGRGFQRLQGDASITISRVVANSILALVVGSVFYNLEDNSGSFYSRGVLLFFAILLNAFASALEILLLYDQRPIVEKHARYRLYHPFAEAISSMICDLPYKICNCIAFNLVLYFMTNLRRTPSAFFTFLAISFVTTLALSMLFRTFGAASRSVVEALPISAVIILALMIYTGFIVPPPEMVPWFSWIRYIDPIAYAFESLMINEFHGRDFDCAAFVPMGPAYGAVNASNHVCSAVGAVAGSSVVSGTDFLKLSFDYEGVHLWRNFGIIIVFTIFFMMTCLIATEYVTEKRSKGEILLFQRTHSKFDRKDLESSSGRPGSTSFQAKATSDKLLSTVHKQTSIFQWRNICLDIKIKKNVLQILDHVDGWVRPGTLTALMGPSGAGKTSLLDALATRTTIGVVTGAAMVDGRKRDLSFQRKTGYAQQQDIHLEHTTVREALCFSAIMRQPEGTDRAAKLAYAEEIIKLLGMESYAEAIVGIQGEGLNIEQRKKLTIATELAAKPELLTFLDEPSSGLDSQTAWAILDLLEVLTHHGQAILCTLHQPSAQLLERFDRLLFLGPNGKTIYFGELGPNCSTLTSYFERNGAAPCPPDANPAEYIMKTIGCIPGSHTDIDWHQVWRNSPEYLEVHCQLDEMEKSSQNQSSAIQGKATDYQEFAASFAVQLWECLSRVNSQYWRSPIYIYSKTALSLLTGLFLGFSFYKANHTMQGLQNQTFSVFMLLTLSSNLVPQICTNFVIQRSIYEARERLSKTYSWQVFMLSNILIELPWNSLMAILVFISWFYPIGMYRDSQPVPYLSNLAFEAPFSMVGRGGTMFLFIWMYFMYSSTFAHMIQAGIELAEMAGNYANLLFTFSLIFCGILATPDAMAGFWIFMYRVSPFTYLVGSILAVGLADRLVQCSDIELLRFDPTAGNSCGTYMESYIDVNGGYVVNPESMKGCEFCLIADTNTFLKMFGIEKGNVWKNFGLLWVYVIANVAGAFLFYWLARVPKKPKMVADKRVSVIDSEKKL